MKINRNLLIVLIIASLAPPLYYRVQEWLKGQYESPSEFFSALLFYSIISVIVTLSISWVILSILHWLNRRLPWNQNILKRLTAEVCLTVPASLALGFAFGTIVYLLVEQGYSPYREVLFNFLAISVIMNFVLVAISDWFYFFERWKSSLVENQKTLTENETLQKEKIIAQYEALKNQINPHFLFNSLNVLSSMVHSDPDKIEEFIDEFANIYRYILEHHEENTVDLKSEISVAQSYAFLQQTRFGKAVQFAFQGFETAPSQAQVFPLSIQTILENAMKHNSASIESPLFIEVAHSEDHVTITNNLQLRKDEPTSTGIGTRNLILRYKALGITPKFEMTSSKYIATLPLLPKSAHFESLVSKQH